MALTGPQNFHKAAELLDKAANERNEVERARILATAQVHATLALVAATVHAGNLTKDEVHQWRTHGVKF
jgi:DNA-binding protein H-NS